jgi:uncharacterized membrane protein
VPDAPSPASTRKAYPAARAGAFAFLLAVAIAIVSFRYVFDLPPIPPLIAGNAFRMRWLAIHAGFAATALLIGGVQFSRRLRARRPGLHRMIGKTYVVSCLLGAGAGFVLALGSAAGPIASSGFGLLAVSWIVVNVLGWHTARRSRFDAHRRWMVCSWALTLSAVTLRLYLPLSELAGLPELVSYRAISFLCWVPNLLVAEWYLRARHGVPDGTPWRGSPHPAATMQRIDGCPRPSR